MVVLLEGSPISTEELWSSVSDHWVLGHVPDKGPFKNGGHVVLRDLQCCRNVSVPFSRSVPQHNPVSELYGQFLRPHCLVLDLTCTVNSGP